MRSPTLRSFRKQLSVVLPYQQHGSFLFVGFARARLGAVVHYVHIGPGLAVLVLVGAVPAYLRVGAVEHLQSLAGVDEYLVFEQVVVSHPEQTIGTYASGSEGVGHPNIAAEYREQTYGGVVAALVVGYYQRNFERVALHMGGVGYHRSVEITVVGYRGQVLVKQPFAVHYRSHADVGEGSLQVLCRYLLRTHAYAGFNLGRFVQRMHVGVVAVVRTYVNRGRVLGVAVGSNVDGEVVVLTVECRVVGRRGPCDVVAVGVGLEGGVTAFAVCSGVEDADNRRFEHLQLQPYYTVAAGIAFIAVRVTTILVQQLTVVVVIGVVADGIVDGGLYGVADKEVEDNGAVATGGALQYMRVIAGTPVDTVDESCNFVYTQSVVHMSDDGVVDMQVQVGDAVAAIQRAGNIRIDARYVVC